MKHRVLVVEDNAFNREMLCDWLDLQDFEVESASNLKEAFAAIERQLPDAILLDVQLGNDDGLALAVWMREHETDKHVPMIAVTAHAMFTEQERILSAGCNACISKPISFELLGQQLKRWLAVSSNRTAYLPARERSESHDFLKEQA
jgi:two-component system, cell cycle response regulator DivK